MFQKPKTAKRLFFDVIPKCVDEYHQQLRAYPGQDATKKLWKVMDSHLRDEFKRTVPLGIFVTPPAVLMMRDKPIRSLADLKGLKIRASSKSAAAILTAYGATPV